MDKYFALLFVDHYGRLKALYKKGEGMRRYSNVYILRSILGRMHKLLSTMLGT